MCVTNFTPVFYPQYRIGLPYGGTLEEIFNSDRAEFAGSNQYNAWTITAEEQPLYDFPFSANICVPPLSTVYYRYDKIMPDPEVKEEPAIQAEETPAAEKKPARKRAAKANADVPKDAAAEKKTARKRAAKADAQAPKLEKAAAKKRASTKAKAAPEAAEAPKSRARKPRAPKTGNTVE